MTDPAIEDTERHVRAAMTRLADGHRPDLDGHRPASKPGSSSGGVGSSSQRRWMLAAASIAVVAVGLAAVALVQRGGDDPVNDGSLEPAVVDSADDDVATTMPTESSTPIDDSEPTEELSGVRIPVDSIESEFDSSRGPGWFVPWADGFLRGWVDEPIDEGGEATVRARFTVDGASWEPIEMTLPPGVDSPGRVTSTGDRVVMAGTVYPADGTEVIRVASTTDLVNWSLQDVESPRLPESTEFGGSFTVLGSLAVNDDGWVFDVRDVYGDDVAVSARSDLVRGTYRLRSDDVGFTVLVYGDDGSPPTPETTFEYTWAEFGITPDQVPYLTGEIPSSRTLTATWDGTPAIAETPVPAGPTLASPEGFVRWNDHTWFSPDGVTWTRSPLPDPTGTVQNAFPVVGGFVAIVVNQEGEWDLYLLDERGGNARRLDIEGVPERFSTGFAGQSIPGLENPATGAALLVAGNSGAEPPLVIDLDGYRYVERNRTVSVIDLATDETVVTFALEGSPGADTWLEFTADGITATDPATETVLMQIPMETFQAALDARRAVLESGISGEDAPEDLRLLASRDGERFVSEPLRSSNPVHDDSSGAVVEPAGTVGAATNGDTLLVRLDDEWIRYVLP